jgi:hypothetical protein
MSAYIVGHAHIDALLTFALSKRYGRRVVYTANETLIEIYGDNASEIGRILLTENERSVRHCYPNDAADDLPRTIGEDSANYEFSPFDGELTPVAVLKGCDCFDFQAYETHDYKSSIACAIIDAIRKRAILCLPEYNLAPGWDFTRKTPAAPAAKASAQTTPVTDAAAAAKTRTLAAAALLLGSIASASATQVGDELESFYPPGPAQTSSSEAPEAVSLRRLYGPAAADFIANIGNTSPEHACPMPDGNPRQFIMPGDPFAWFCLSIARAFNVAPAGSPIPDRNTEPYLWALRFDQPKNR